MLLYVLVFSFCKLGGVLLTAGYLPPRESTGEYESEEKKSGRNQDANGFEFSYSVSNSLSSLVRTSIHRNPSSSWLPCYRVLGIRAQFYTPSSNFSVF